MQFRCHAFLNTRSHRCMFSVRKRAKCFDSTSHNIYYDSIQQCHTATYYPNSSLSRLLYCRLGFMVWKCGKRITSGQTAGQGEPQILLMHSSCASSLSAWKRGFFVKSSARMHLQGNDRRPWEGTCVARASNKTTFKYKTKTNGFLYHCLSNAQVQSWTKEENGVICWTRRRTEHGAGKTVVTLNPIWSKRFSPGILPAAPNVYGRWVRFFAQQKFRRSIP